jgi:hypothetical protein
MTHHEETLTLYGVSFETLEVPTATEASAQYSGTYQATRGAKTCEGSPAVFDLVYNKGSLSKEVGDVVRTWVSPADPLTVVVEATSDKGAKTAQVAMRPQYGKHRRGRHIELVLEYAHGETVDFGPGDESNPDLRYRIRAHNLRLVGSA